MPPTGRSDPGDARRERRGSFEPHIEEVRAKAQLLGVTKRGVYECLIHRYPGEGLVGYSAFTQFMRSNGIAVGCEGYRRGYCHAARGERVHGRPRK